MTEILMPRLSDSMQEGTIISWLKSPGEQIRPDDELAEIETDKATVTYAAEVRGVLEIIAAEGSTVAVGDPIARVVEPSAIDDPTARFPAPSAIVDGGAIARAPAPTPTADARSPGAGGRNGRERRLATPLARRVAAAHGVVLDGLEGTGPLGRITRADVLRCAGAPARGQSGPEPSSATRATSRHEPNRVQQVIARRMAHSKATIPHFQVQTDVVMDAATAMRAELKTAVQPETAPSINDLIVRAAALALRDHPLANGSFRDGAFHLHQRINIGIAVATDDALVVPTVRDADCKSVGQIARETRNLAARVRSGEITPAELEAATFTVSNLGMFGMTAIVGVINPPQAAILGVGAIRDVLARVDGEIVDRSVLTLTLSCDHRILYGAEAARFLARIRELLESPLAMMF